MARALIPSSGRRAFRVVVLLLGIAGGFALLGMVLGDY